MTAAILVTGCASPRGITGGRIQSITEDTEHNDTSIRFQNGFGLIVPIRGIDALPGDVVSLLIGDGVLKVEDEPDEPDVKEYPLSNVKVMDKRYPNVLEFAEVCTISEVRVVAGRLVWKHTPEPPWDTYKVSSWRAQGSVMLIITRKATGLTEVYWGDYYERDRNNRNWSEVEANIAAQGGEPLAESDVLSMCVCDGARARKGSKRSNVVVIEFP